MKRWTTVLTAGLCLTLTAPAAQADRGRPVVVLGGPVAIARPAYRPYVVDLAPAPVVRVREPRQECWDEVVRYPASGRTESATPTILGGIVGEGLLGPYLAELLRLWLPERTAANLSLVGSVAAVTSLFVVFADLVPKRLGMAEPERVAMAMVGPMGHVLLLFKPIVWLYTACTDLVMRLLGLPT